jgi:hypothetical protein
MKKICTVFILSISLLLILGLNNSFAVGEPCDPGYNQPYSICGGGEVCLDNASSPQGGTCQYLSAVRAAVEQSAADNFLRPYGTTGHGRGYFEIVRQSMDDFVAPGAPRSGTTAMLRGTAMLFQERPASTGQYIAYVGKNLGLIKNAEAQGYGFTALSPILEIWSLMRNIALVGFVIIFVVVGIMIMLRKQIDPRTVVTVQLALPKIVISLLLVIFSYAIAGILIDIVTVLTRLGATILQGQHYIAYVPGSDANARNAALNRLLSANITELWGQLYNFNIVANQFRGLEEGLGQIRTLLGIAFQGGLAQTVLLIALFIALVRTFFMLLTAYLQVTLRIIFAPLQFLFYAIPGQGGGFGGWLRGMLSEILVFPLVFFMLSLAVMFSTQTADTQYWHTNATYSNDISSGDNLWKTGNQVFGNQGYWVAPALGNWGPAVGPLLGLGIMLTIPRAGAMIRELFQQRPGATEGAAAEGIQRAAQRIPLIGSFTRA